MPTPASDNSTRVLGRLLLVAGAIGAAELAEALEEQRRTRERLGEILVRRGTDPRLVARALAKQLRLPYAEPPLRPHAAALKLVERSLAARLRVVPLGTGEKTLRVAVADPLDLAAVDDLQFQTGRRIEAVVTTPAAVDEALALAYEDGTVQRLLTRIPAPASAVRAAVDGEDLGALRRASEAPPIVALVDHILERGLRSRASDLHLEPARGRLRVRARVDGMLREIMVLPAHASAAVVSRIKIMAGLDIAVKLRPQDGRTTVRAAGRELWLRVSTLPADGGEKVVLRLLEPENAGRGLEDVGFDEATHDRFARLLTRGHGVLLVTGPTGSGKTTTLYGALAALDRERRNVITLEDPIEYRLSGLTQVQVHARAGLSFAAALRAVLRQDPDVVMVGELRDRETVEVGMAAAMTGHLVLSTLHTNDAPGAVARLTEMGAAPYLVAGGLIGVLAQRLVRRLCAECRRRRTAAAGELRALGLPDRPLELFCPGACERCGGTGYHGRVGIFELLVVDAPTRRLIHQRAPADALRDAARGAGMVPMGLDALRKLEDGLTSLDEVAPLLTLVADETPVCPACGRQLRSEFLVCPGCRHRLRARCGCGAELEAGWEWCPRCGASARPDDGG